jgi:hypothetical protein
MNFNYFELESNHTYIQWLFPTNEPSNMVRFSPILEEEEAKIIIDDFSIILKIEKSFFKIVDFLGFELINQKLISKNGIPFWLNGKFNHNILRSTRIIKSLKLFKMDLYAKLFYEAIYEYKNNVTFETINYWEEAINWSFNG